MTTGAVVAGAVGATITIAAWALAVAGFMWVQRWRARQARIKALAGKVPIVLETEQGQHMANLLLDPKDARDVLTIPDPPTGEIVTFKYQRTTAKDSVRIYRRVPAAPTPPPDPVIDKVTSIDAKRAEARSKLRRVRRRK